jgi:hypothetical protein
MSILEFARSFAKFKSDLSQSSVPDHQLLHFIRFWPRIKSKLGDKSYSTYIDEWLALIPLVTNEAIFDLLPDELEALSDILDSLEIYARQESLSTESKHKRRMVQYKLIKILLYLGDFEKALKLSAEFAGCGEIPKYEDSSLPDPDSFECLKTLSNLYLQSNPHLASLLKEVFDEWEAERTEVSANSAWCIFVEKNEVGGVTRGRLRRLKGLVEVSPSSGEKDEEADTVSFDNQVKSPDDPLIGVVYDALVAVRNLIDRSGLTKHLTRPYRSFYSIDDRQFTFTGDSIGLAAGIIAYTQLLSGEVLREKKRISSSVGFTGGMDQTGKLLPVNRDTIYHKIERAFYSPLKQVVLPEECVADAVLYLEKLSQRYPRRRLRIVGFRWLSEVVDSHDVLNHQRVSAGVFIVRKVYKNTRTARIQIPLLLALIYIGVCLFHPKAWIGFDRNLFRVETTDNGFYVVNSKGQKLWSKENICPESPQQGEGYRTISLVVDLDNDHRNEVLLLPEGKQANKCELNAHLLAYDHSGNLMLDKSCVMKGEYPGDESDSVHFHSEDLAVLNLGNKKIIKTTVNASNPARAYHKFWSVKGELLGWYVHAGFGGDYERLSVLDSQGRLLMLNYNNRLKKVGLCALYPDSAFGVSPPYTDSMYDLSWVKHGNQISYINFPRSDISKTVGASYDGPELIQLVNNKIRVDIKAADDPHAEFSYFINSNFRVYDISPSDGFYKVWHSLAKDGSLPDTNLAHHFEYLLNNVAYWTDSGWVTEGQLRAAGK